jgi:putative lipoic acid-binding regulatory protein
MQSNGDGGTGGEGGGPSRFEYPLRYPLKVIGLAAEDFPAHARALVEQAAGGPAVEPPSVRASGGGKYLSVTVVVLLDSEARRQAVYQALRDDPRVVYAL